MQRVSQLILKKMSGRLTPAEEAELQAWLNESEANRRLYGRLTDPAVLKETFDLWRMVDSSRPCRDMQNQVNRMLWSSRIRRWSVAAAVVLAVLVAGSIIVGRMDMRVSDSPIASRTEIPQSVEDIKHGVTRAVLSDEAGHNVVLNATDTAKVTTILLAGHETDSIRHELCLDVPRGGEFKVQLEDGTEVWLNSASRLYYPNAFGNDMRHIRVEGEAYLAVATDSLRPFYVETDNQMIRVYGTSFNVRCYPEDREIYTTLEKGKVSIRRADEVGGELFLTPGHQAVFASTDSKVSVREVNTDVITSWRNGRFVFENQTLLRIMQDLSRWYDFEYEFADSSLENEEFMGSIPRYSDFTTAISILEKCGGIRFSVDDGKVRITRTDN